MNKKTLWIAVALVLVVALLVGVYFATRPETTEGMKSFTVTVVHKDGTTKDIPLKSDKEYLGDCLEAEGIIVAAQGAGKEGMFDTVDGEKAVFETDSAYWGFYVGGEYATLGIYQTPIEEGAVYKLEHTVWTE